MVVSDATMDDRFANNELVTSEPHIQFDASAPIVVEGAALGTLCVIDDKPRSLEADGLPKLVHLPIWLGRF